MASRAAREPDLHREIQYSEEEPATLLLFSLTRFFFYGGNRMRGAQAYGSVRTAAHADSVLNIFWARHCTRAVRVPDLLDVCTFPTLSRVWIVTPADDTTLVRQLSGINRRCREETL